MTPPFSGLDPIAQLERLRAILDPPDSCAFEPKRGDGDLDGLRALAPPRNLKPAAVLAPLVIRPQGLHLILTRRADHLSRHAGQIAFPGGRLDPSDPGPVDAALREAEEEIGLSRGLVEILGAFDAYETVTGYCIAPVGGLVDPAFAPRPDPAEVAEVFEAPLGFLMDARNHRTGAREVAGVRRAWYEMPWGDRYIWGATAGMLKSLHDRLTEEALSA